jgi:beta-glucosidase
MKTDLELKQLITRMTLEEKAALCTGASSWTTTPVERLGIPELTCSDGPHGVRKTPKQDDLGAQSLPATCFPTSSCMASTWNVDLVKEVGQALAEECIALNVDVVLGPGANMKRSPLCGRNFEYYSEDPYLAGELAAAMIEGVQSKGVGTSLKHFAANNQEFQRFSIDAQVDERTLREIYLPAFEKAVKKGKPWTVMCSYNKLNGPFASESHYLLTDILKNEWGFEGLVVSDWGAVRNRVAAMKAGLDWEMPGPQDRRVKAVVAAVKSGELDEAVLDESVRRILRIVFMSQDTPKGGSFDIEAHHALAQKAAVEGMVLLKNNGLLPLKGQQHIAVIGRSAEQAHFQGGGSSHINPTQVTVPMKALKSNAGAAEIAFAEGYPTDNSIRQDLIDQAAAIAASADAAVLYIALPTFKESEGYDRKDIDLTDQQILLIKAVSAVQPKTVVVLNNGSAVAMSEWIDGVAAVLESHMMGQAGGGAIADILFGKVNPSGKLAETYPAKLSDTPAYINFPGENGKVYYGEGIFIGYRYYEERQIPVQFPFGFGLSYTTFAYSNANLSATTFNDVDGLTVSVDVTNTGSLAGQEIVQVYVRDPEASVKRPQKELKGFAKVSLNPGETKTVTIPLDFRAFAYYHIDHKTWVAESGEFEILIGASSADIRAKLAATLVSTQKLPCILDQESTVREWLNDPIGKQVFAPFFAEMEAASRKRFGGGERYPDKEKDDGMGMGDIMEMLNDMPLVSVLAFQASMLPKSPEEIVGELLQAAHSLG